MDRLTTRRFSSAAAAGTSPGAQPPHPPPPPRLPTPPPLAPRTPRTRRRSTPQSAPPQLPGFRKAPGAGRQQPLAAQRLGIRVPARAPAELRLPGRLRGAMISYTAVPASGVPRAPAVAAGGPDPHPAPPPKPPQTPTPSPPGSSPPRTEPRDALCRRAPLPAPLCPSFSPVCRRLHHAALRPGLPGLLSRSSAASPKHLRQKYQTANPGTQLLESPAFAFLM